MSRHIIITRVKPKGRILKAERLKKMELVCKEKKRLPATLSNDILRVGREWWDIVFKTKQKSCEMNPSSRVLNDTECQG